MGILALLIGLGIGVLAIVVFITYWVVMAMLLILGIVFVFWAVLFTILFGDPYVGSLCSVVATGMTFWLYSIRGDGKGSG